VAQDLSVARVLAIDIGTSSIRATLYNRSLQPVRPGTQIRYRWRVGSDGSVEAAPAAIERALAQAIDGALDAVTTRVDAVAIAAFWHSLIGVRSPDYLPDARAVIAGMRLATTRDDIFRAGLESVAYEFQDVFGQLVKVSAVTRVVATGGALTASRVWPQLLADVLGRQIALPRATELTSRGAAIIGFEQLGISPMTTEPGILRVLHPDARSHAVYREAAARQQQLLRAVLT